MSGKILYRPPAPVPPHKCEPDRWAVAQPPGSIWQCECGQVRESMSVGGFYNWYRESNRRRRRREKKMGILVESRWGTMNDEPGD
jgi:hypothetical protein